MLLPMILKTNTLLRKLVDAQDKVITAQENQVECMREVVESADRQRTLVETENDMMRELLKLETQ